MHALVANPSRRRRRRRTTKRRRTRARRTRSYASNPPRRKRRVRRRRRLRAVGSVRIRSRKYRGRKRRTVRRTLYARNRRRRSYRRNPRRRSVGRLFSFATLKYAFKPYAIGFGTSLVLAVVDKAAARYPAVGGFTKLGVGIASIMMFGKGAGSTAAIASLAACTGYAMGTKLAGGIIARTPEEAADGLGAMYNDYPMEMGALLNGLGVLTGPEAVEPAVMAYESALTEDDDDY